MPVLIAGGTEFISLHPVRALLRGGHAVTARNRGRHPERLPAGVRTIAGDRRDHAMLRRALAGERVDAPVDVSYAPTTGDDVRAVVGRYRREGLDRRGVESSADDAVLARLG